MSAAPFLLLLHFQICSPNSRIAYVQLYTIELGIVIRAGCGKVKRKMKRNQFRPVQQQHSTQQQRPDDHFWSTGKSGRPSLWYQRRRHGLRDSVSLEPCQVPFVVEGQRRRKWEIRKERIKFREFIFLSLSLLHRALSSTGKLDRSRKFDQPTDLPHLPVRPIVSWR